MKAYDSFSKCHPAVNALYFGLVLLFSMCLMHPVSLLVSLGSAVAYSVSLTGGSALKTQLTVLLPLAVFAALVNGAFNHAGVTILIYLPSGNPLTLESVAYGAAAAAMLACVVIWLGCCAKVMTADKFVFLFGRVLPALSMLLSMTLRFLPRFKDRFQAVEQARRPLYGDEKQAGFLGRIKRGVTVLSVTVTWALENAIDTADGMKSRGYGLPGRTSFSVFTFDERDRELVAWLCTCGFFLICGWAAGGMEWHWFPSIRRGPVTALTVCFQLAYLALCLTPLILNAKEDGLWKRSRSGT